MKTFVHLLFVLFALPCSIISQEILAEPEVDGDATLHLEYDQSLDKGLILFNQDNSNAIEHSWAISGSENYLTLGKTLAAFIGENLDLFPAPTLVLDTNHFVGINNGQSKARLHVIHNDDNEIGGEQPGLAVGVLSNIPNAVNGYLTINQPASDANTDVVRFRYDGSSVVKMNSSAFAYQLTVYGDALAANGMWVDSDQRFKEEILPITSSLSDIRKLNPSRYLLKKGNAQYKNEQQFGLIAQELKEVYPNLVRLSERQDETGQAIGDFYSVNYFGLIPVLITSIQELDEAIQDKDAALIDLQEQNTSLEKRIEFLEKQFRIISDKR